ncbi:MAG: restriction endonuclease [Phycisphaerales bacterium]|nr:restriction endonuclease [Phycisphaerales bacterium]
MALWLVRAGRHGEHEERFFTDKRVYLTWDRVFEQTDPTGVKDYDGVKDLVGRLMPSRSGRKLGHTAGQFWAFILGMKPGDLVVCPRKPRSAIAVGEVAGGVEYDAKRESPYQVARPIKWLNTEVPRSAFDQDLLYSMGAFMTICEIKRNDAEKRVRAMAANGWKSSGQVAARPKRGGDEEGGDVPDADVAERDLAETARDQLAREILRLYKGHGMQRLVAGILEAQGFSTHTPPDGPDKGIDVVAAPGPLGFGSPRICVQVKSGDGQVDRPTLQQLTGAMQDVKADHGLLVAWGGFKSTVDREAAAQFFKVRLWDQGDLLDALLQNYEKLPPDIKRDLPLQRIWVLAKPEEDSEEE